MNQPNETSVTKVACFGEIIWDSMPHGLFMGGAPYNVAYHLARLKQPCMLISAVGRDELGRIALKKAKESQIDISCIQVSDYLPTGLSEIAIQENGDAKYEIRKPVAWDEIATSQVIFDKLVDCTAMVFGTLASRSGISRETLFELLEGYQGLTICDVNLRPPFDDASRAIEIAKRAQVVKLNEDELIQLTGADYEKESLETALARFKEQTGADMVFVTRGKNPAVYFDGSRMIFATPPSSSAVVDTVGAGDAFTAAMTQGLLENITIESCLDRAVKLGSFVASKSGAQPRYDPEDALESLFV